jgi:hypothetical protein
MTLVPFFRLGAAVVHGARKATENLHRDPPARVPYDDRGRPPQQELSPPFWILHAR